MYGYTLIHNGRTYRYPGFVEGDGVRYLGQSVLLVDEHLVADLAGSLAEIGVDLEMDPGSVG